MCYNDWTNWSFEAPLEGKFIKVAPLNGGKTIDNDGTYTMKWDSYGMGRDYSKGAFRIDLYKGDNLYRGMVHNFGLV